MEKWGKVELTDRIINAFIRVHKELDQAFWKIFITTLYWSN